MFSKTLTLRKIQWLKNQKKLLKIRNVYCLWLNNFWDLSKSKEVSYLRIWWRGDKDGKTEFVFDVDHCKRTLKKRKISDTIFWNYLRSGEKMLNLKRSTYLFYQKEDRGLFLLKHLSTLRAEKLLLWNHFIFLQKNTSLGFVFFVLFVCCFFFKNWLTRITKLQEHWWVLYLLKFLAQCQVPF